MGVIVTLSFDDGFKTDLKLAYLLEAYDFRGTFFIIANRIDKGPLWLSREDLAWLAERHEIGSHTLSHACLTKLRAEEVYNELWVSKLLLEDIVNRPIHGLAYPFGAYTESIAKVVRVVGYEYARTITPFHVKLCKDRYAIRVTAPLDNRVLSSPSHVIRALINEMALRVLISVLLEQGLDELVSRVIKKRVITWYELVIKIASILNKASELTGRTYVLSLWGHSLEICANTHSLYEFEKLLAYLQNLKVNNLTLHELVNFYSSMR